jgi:FemAB-related protein (PEP-CTERM system-associated)
MGQGGREAWRSYVEQHPQATFFHDLKWADAVANAFGHRRWYLTTSRGGRLTGVLPLFELNSLLAGRLLVSLPYATYGGVLADDGASAEALLEAARELADRVGARSLELRSLTAAGGRLETRRTHARFRRELPGRVEEVAGAIPRKARAAARRAAERHDLGVERGAHLLKPVWRLYARSMRRLGSPNYPLRFFRELLGAAPGASCLQLIRLGRRPVAGLMSFLHRDTVMPYFAGLDERAEVYGLHNFMYVESMQWAVGRGYRYYDMGRTRLDNPGPMNFKRFLGFEPEPLEYQCYVPAGRRAPDLSPASSRWSAARSVWKALPLLLTRPLGGWLARSIPG